MKDSIDFTKSEFNIIKETIASLQAKVSELNDPDCYVEQEEIDSALEMADESFKILDQKEKL